MLFVCFLLPYGNLTLPGWLRVVLYIDNLSDVHAAVDVSVDQATSFINKCLEIDRVGVP